MATKKKLTKRQFFDKVVAQENKRNVIQERIDKLYDDATKLEEETMIWIRCNAPP